MSFYKEKKYKAGKCVQDSLFELQDIKVKHLAAALTENPCLSSLDSGRQTLLIRSHFCKRTYVQIKYTFKDPLLGHTLLLCLRWCHNVEKAQYSVRDVETHPHRQVGECYSSHLQLH